VSNLPSIEVFLRADPLEAVVVSDPPVEVNQPIFQTINPGNFATAEQGELAETALQPEAIVDFETATQLNARDTANRNRTNHSGTQAIDTISGLQSALDGKATAAQGAKADSALQPLANISLLTNDAGYLSAIPNGAIINGIAHFNQDSKPTTRIDGSALVVRDKWYRTTDGTDWFWNGTYWVERTLRSTEPRLTDGTFAASGMYLYQASYGAEQPAELGFVILESVSVLSYPGQLVQFGNSSNNRSHVFRFYTSGSTNTFHTTPASHLMPSVGYKATIGLATYLLGFSITTTVVGSPVAYTPPRTIYYRNAIP
jgi:hypothetical protein